jgi:hypothetical protein
MILVRDIEFQLFMKSAILNLRPISSSTCTGYLPFYGSNCGLKGAAILHNWLPCAIQACGTQALAVPFCISACNMKSFREKLNNNFEADPVLRKRVAIALSVGTLLLLIFIFSTGSSNAPTNTPTQSNGEISLLCSKETDEITTHYYLVNTVGVVGKTLSLPGALTDLTVQMSRYPSKSGWDTNALCDPNKIDLPESDWRILSIGSDCGVGASIAACDIDTIANDRGVTGLHLFPLKNGYYSGASGKVEKGTLIRVSGKVPQ